MNLLLSLSELFYKKNCNEICHFSKFSLVKTNFFSKFFLDRNLKAKNLN